MGLVLFSFFSSSFAVLSVYYVRNLFALFGSAIRIRTGVIAVHHNIQMALESNKTLPTEYFVFLLYRDLKTGYGKAPAPSFTTSSASLMTNAATWSDVSLMQTE